MAYPTIQAANNIKQTTIKKAHRQTSSAGYNLSRPAGTIGKKSFQIFYTALTATERNTLQTYFETNQGASFSWTHPETGGATYTVMFTSDELTFAFKHPDYWTIDFGLIEV